MSKGSGTETVTQKTELPPQATRALDFLLQQSMGVANQFSPVPTQPQFGALPGRTPVSPQFGGIPQGFSGINFPTRGFGMGLGFTGQQPTQPTGGQPAAPAPRQSVEPRPITPELSDPTLAGINQLTQPFGGPGVDVLSQTASGQFLGANPFTNVNPLAFGSNEVTGVNPFAFSGNDLSGVTDAITQAATRAVGDRFSQAGRSGSPAEGLSLASTVSRELAPFAFGARESQLGRQFGAGESALERGFTGREAQLGRQFGAGESALGRGFGGFEAERGRQLASAQPLIGLQQQGAQNLLSAGEILEQQEREQLLDPFTRLNLISDPLIRALGGQPGTQTTTQPLSRNVGAGLLGGAATGAGIGSLVGLSGLGPLGAAAGIGGLLGGFF